VRPFAALALLALTLAGCGGGGDEPAEPRRDEPREPQKSERTRPARADPEAVRVIRAWVAAERAGRMDRAASYFALPAIVVNVSDALLLPTRRAVRAFNASLPCGAVFLRAAGVGEWTVAYFRLTHRVGSRCDAPGSRAATAFKFRRGRIAQWIRVPEDIPPEDAVRDYTPQPRTGPGPGPRPGRDPGAGRRA
jgi:hypothetical protein